MRFVSFIANQQDGQTPVSINPERVVAVIAVMTPNGRTTEYSAIEVGDRVIEVVGSVAEVVAALAGADAERSMMSLFEAERLLIGRMAMDPARAASDLRALAVRLRGTR